MSRRTIIFPLSAARMASRGAAAFTLVEMVVSLGILSVLTVAIASAIVIAARAVPDGRGRAGQIAAAGKGADLLSQELYYAQSVTPTSATSVTFTMAPR